METREEIIENWETEGRHTDWYAIDTYDPITGRTHRQFVGTEDEAWKLFVSTYALPSTTAMGSFHRVQLVSADDARRFFEGDESMPDERGEYSVTEAAGILGVSRQRVHQLIEAGLLDAHRVGRSWLVYRYSVENRLKS